VQKEIIPKDIELQIIEDYKSGCSVLSLSKKYGYKYHSTYSIIKKHNITIRGNDYTAKVFKNDSFVFDCIDTEEKAYWLGFIYADGCIRKSGNNLKLSVALAIQDKRHLEKLQSFLKTDAPVREYHNKNGRSYCRLSIIDRHMCEQLIQKGVYIRKTEIITFPTFLDETLIRHFIRGYVDGDGSITFHKHNVNSNRLVYSLKITSTKEMLESIHKYLPKNKATDYPTFEKRRKNNVNNYSVSYGGNLQVLKMLDYLYADTTIYLDRKYERYLLLKSYYTKYSRLYW